MNAIAALAREQPQLCGLLCRFNHDPAEYLHPSRRSRFVEGIGGDRVWEEPRARRRLSAYILEKLSLSGRFCHDLGHPELTIALLDTADLLHLARCVGGVLLRQHVRRSMSRQDVLAWKQRLTPPGYAYVMSTGSLLPLAATQVPDDGSPVENLGYACIDECLATTPEEIRVRASLKLPVELPPPAIEPAAARQLVHAVHSTLHPQWRSSFARLRS